MFSLNFFLAILLSNSIYLTTICNGHNIGDLQHYSAQTSAISRQRGGVYYAANGASLDPMTLTHGGQRGPEAPPQGHENYTPSNQNQQQQHTSVPEHLVPQPLLPQQQQSIKTQQQQQQPQQQTSSAQSQQQTGGSQLAPPRVETGGFHPSVDSIQRGTTKFVQGVRQGIVKGLDEFLGTHPQQQQTGSKPVSPATPSGQYQGHSNEADPAAVVSYGSSYQPFLFNGNSPTRKLPLAYSTSGTYQPNQGGLLFQKNQYQDVPTAANQKPQHLLSSPQPNGQVYSRYNSPLTSSPQQFYNAAGQTQQNDHHYNAGSPQQQLSPIRQNQQAPTVSHWFRRDPVTLGRNLPIENDASLTSGQPSTYSNYPSASNIQIVRSPYRADQEGAQSYYV